MIDLEPEVFGQIKAMLLEKHPGLAVSNEWEKIPTAFPCVTVEMTDNAVNKSTSTGSAGEVTALLTLRTDVYSKAETGKKAECKAILADVDGLLAGLGFLRDALGPDRDREDFSYYQLTALYKAEADTNNNIL